MIERVGRGPFEMQCLPTDHSLLGVDGYKAFVRERRKLVAKRLNEFLSSSV